MKNKDDKKTFPLSFPAELVEKIDRQAKARYTTRSQYIRDAVVERLNNEAALEDSPIPVLTYDEMRRRNLKKYLNEKVRYSEFTEDIR